MELIADIFLVSGTLGVGFYCIILSKRLNRFNSLENGIGGAVAVLSAQVDDLEKVINSAKSTASDSAASLIEVTNRASEIARQLELKIASLHDISPPPSNVDSTIDDKNSAKPMFTRHAEKGASH